MHAPPCGTTAAAVAAHVVVGLWVWTADAAARLLHSLGFGRIREFLETTPRPSACLRGAHGCARTTRLIWTRWDTQPLKRRAAACSVAYNFMVEKNLLTQPILMRGTAAWTAAPTHCRPAASEAKTGLQAINLSELMLYFAYFAVLNDFIAHSVMGFRV